MGLPTHSPPEIQKIIDILKTNFRCRTSIYWNKRLDVIGTRFLWPDSLHENFKKQVFLQWLNIIININVAIFS